MTRSTCLPHKGGSDIQFHVKAATSLSEIVRHYGIPGIDAPGNRTIGQYLEQALDGSPLTGDRVSHGAIDLVVASLNEAGGIETVGLVIDDEDPGIGAIIAQILQKGLARLKRFGPQKQTP